MFIRTCFVIRIPFKKTFTLQCNVIKDIKCKMITYTRKGAIVKEKKICRKRIKMDMEDIQVLKEYYVYGGIHKEGKGL